jgi:hypothetical protein
MRVRRKEPCLLPSGCKADLTQTPASDRGHQSDFGLPPTLLGDQEHVEKRPEGAASASRRLTASSGNGLKRLVDVTAIATASRLRG